MFSRPVLLALVLVIIAGAAHLYWKQDQPAPQVRAQAPAAPAKPAASAPTSSSSKPGDAKPWIALPMPSAATRHDQSKLAPLKPRLTLADISQPPEGTPLKDVVLQLRDAADQGIPQAACHLGVELLRCARFFSAQSTVERAQAAAASGQTSAASQNLAREASAASQVVSRDQALCGNVSAELAGEGWRYVYQAATSGNVAAMSRFVRDPGFDAARTTPADEGRAAFERDANHFLGEAIKGGDVRALYHAWLLASGANPAHGAKAFQREPDYAIAYAEALRGLFDQFTDRAIERATSRLAAEVGRARAEPARREGERLREMYFANATQIDKGNDDTVTNVADCWK